MPRKEFLQSLGFNPKDSGVWSAKFRLLKWNAERRQKTCSLTFEDYIRLAAEKELYDPSLIGRTKGSYQLARFGDQGDYELGNCRFISQAENIAEKALNGGNASMSAKKTGRTAETSSGIASQARKLSKSFRVVSPTGVVFEDTNLRKFCRIHALKQAGMALVCSGKVNSYAGWTGSYVRREDEKAS